MVLAGGAYAALVVSSFSRAQKRVLDMGYADDINTYVMISGENINKIQSSNGLNVTSLSPLHVIQCINLSGKMNAYRTRQEQFLRILCGPRL